LSYADHKRNVFARWYLAGMILLFCAGGICEDHHSNVGILQFEGFVLFLAGLW